ncbi:MAG: IS3 family transposase [Pantoea sp. Morm]|uniref:IS3 family transposase n=1 Tax=Pantoea sp. Morm TaxID=2601250 RepID=UPI001DCCA6DC|nr:IS3 family transposase [Pantoea sp. Morm]
MHSYEDRIRAVELYFRYGKRLTVVVRELGYPSVKQLGRWVRIFEEYGDLPRELKPRKRYSHAQKVAAVEHYLTHGGCLAYTRRAIGFPSNEVLKSWIEEIYPGRRPLIIRSNTNKCFSQEERIQAVRELCTRRGTALKVAQKVGVSVPLLYKWKKDLIDDEAYQSMRKRKSAPPDKQQDALLDEVKQLKQQVHQLQLERDILTKANELIKKDMGISVLTLKNREKTQLVDALKESYPVAELLSALQLARSCYFYHKASLRLHDKYAEIRITIAKIFEGNYRCYGYRRLHAMLRQNNTHISEKVVRRLMAEEQLIVKRAGRRRYSAYCGEIGQAPENLLARNFRSCRPNEKWLTDITEFQLPAGKVYLSPVIDCFDGKVVSWTIGTRPDAKLVNAMLDDAIDTLREHERPVIHSDRGSHYRWPGWLDRINTSGLIRSMSRKGCSSDNAACEGFFGRVKNEMYYGRSWAGITLEDFMCFLDRYIRWYNESRIKISLGAMSPVSYRQHLGITT